MEEYFIIGKCEKYLHSKIKEEKSILLALYDPPKLDELKIDPKKCAQLAYHIGEAGVAASMIGGSTGVSGEMIDCYSKKMKELFEEKGIYHPIIQFPAGAGSIGKCTDAIWFMSLLNSGDLSYIISSQVQGAPIIEKYGIEPIPLAYLVVEPGGTVGHLASARLIPRDKPELAADYARAAQYLGFRFVYLEAGSGVEQPVPNEMVSAVRNKVKIRVGVGGGIRRPEEALEKARSGADFIVVGTKIEEMIKDGKQIPEIKEEMKNMVEALREGAKKRSTSY